MRPIPATLKSDMEADPFYSRCCITGQYKTSVKIEWHHALIFAGRQVNEKWCILPLAKEVHNNIVRYKEKCDWIMLNRVDEKELLRYCKAVDYIRLKKELNKKYGEYHANKR